MISFLLFGSALAGCGLGVDIDPAPGACVKDDNGYSTLDADSSSEIPISLVVSVKGETTDAFGKKHGETTGTLSDKANNRYILSCPQTAGFKTVKLTVTRPAYLTEFGGEWVQMFPKDSWTNVTNEYEPFTFNEYGAKIPLAEFRETTTGLADDAPKVGTLNIFMEVNKEGDYEFKYGNPQLKIDDYWVAVEFKSTLLRVGSPWANCAADTLPTPSYSIGSIMPILFGGPNLNSIAHKPTGDLPSYDAAIADISGVSVPVKIVLEVFNKDKTSYTSSKVDKQCYKAGNTCPEAHSVCKPSYCEMDVWASIIEDFKSASSTVTVLGSVGEDTLVSAYDDLEMDGFYFTNHTVPEAGYEGTSVVAIGTPLFDENVVDKATVYVTLASNDTGLWNPFSWYPDELPSKWAAIVTDATGTDDVAKLVDRGYGYVFLTSESGFETQSSMTESVITAIKTEISKGNIRRLESRGLEASGHFWGCDDTLFHCQPVCMKQSGPVTTKVADSLCADAPMDKCACKCFHDAQWACDGDAVVCKAKFGAGELKTVGDKVCETRGAPKPTSTAELRMANQCEPMKEMRGTAPTEECLARWRTPEPVEEPKKEKTSSEETAAAEANNGVPLLDESFAAPMALVALALYA